jgi:protein-tyrosine-phosphatase
MKGVTILVVASLISIPAPSIEAAFGAEPDARQVLFVCEHGNVKSLMAASYFNRIAKKKGLPFHAIARGVAPDSTSVPVAIARNLRNEGFDVGEFRPSAVSGADLSAAERIIAISAPSLVASKTNSANVEYWDDVPAASSNYAAASASLKEHVNELIEQLMR